MSRGPVMEAYADGAFERPCPNCRVSEGDFCVHTDGTLRRIPCIARTVTRERAESGSAGRTDGKGDDS